MGAIFSSIKDEKPYMTELRRHFHQYPEAAFEEFRTAEKIGAELSAMGIPHKRVGETGVLGIIKGGKPGAAASGNEKPGAAASASDSGDKKPDAADPASDSGKGKIIVLRADIDALRIQEENDVPYRSKISGFMHACGHDGHIASLLGAAKVLMAAKDSFSGEIRLVFQQAEESGGRAKLFIDAGALNGAGRAFGVHMMPDMDAGKIAILSGPVFAAIDHFIITVKGRSAHIATPQDGADALYAACQIVSAFQALVTRGKPPLEPALIGVGKLAAGTAHNIIAEEAVLEGSLRTFNAELRGKLKDRMEELSALVAAASGAKREIVWSDFSSVLVNDAEVRKEAAAIAASMAGPVITDHERLLGGDDFAEFLLAVPGAYAFIGCKDPAKPGAPLHNCRFDLDEDSLVYAAGMYAEYTAWYLADSWESAALLRS